MSIPGTAPDPDGFDLDRALARLEDVLLAVPFDRALPDLELLLDRAGVPREVLRRDERILKVLHEASVARPFGQVDDVQRTRAEVELCTLEVEVLTQRLEEHAGDPGALAAVHARLDAVRSRLDEIRGLL